jgi:hypothetical protein
VPKSDDDAKDWAALAAEVRKRRTAMGLRQGDLEARGGPSNGTVRNIEQAARTSYAPRTFTQLEHALGWKDGQAEEILNGTAKEEDLRSQWIRPTSIPSGERWGVPTFTVDPAPATATGAAHDATVKTEDGEPIVVTVAELLRRLAAAERRTPTMGEAVDVLSRLLRELYGPERKDVGEQ